MPELIWYAERGYGYRASEGYDYDADYWQHYVDIADTPLGRAITQARVDLVRRYWPGNVVDVGIGCGAFIEAHGAAMGYDVNPIAVEWLRTRDLYFEVGWEIGAVTLWDTMEHLEQPERLLRTVKRWAFVTMPVYDSVDHCLRSKHFKPDEHLWYFTRAGLLGFMDREGWDCVEHNTMESLLGREDSHTFVFRRR